MQVYIDGKYYDKEEAKISVFDHGLLYGDGIFEGIRIYNGAAFKLREHLIRLFESAKAIYLTIDLTLEELELKVNESIKINKKENGYIRLLVTRGDGPLGIDPFQCLKSKIIIIVSDIQLYPKEYYEKGIEICISSYKRIPVDCFDPRIKSLNYLNNILAKIEAKKNNYFEAIMLNQDGYVAECTADNIFIVKNDELFTPSKQDGALEGITRNFVIEISEKAGLKVHQTRISRFDLYTSDECFITGTGAEIMPISKIDGREIGAGSVYTITNKIIKNFKKSI